MHWKKRFAGDDIIAEEFGGKEPTMTITRITSVTKDRLDAIDDDEAGPQKQQAEPRKKNCQRIEFKELPTPRGWTVVKTNAICLAAMFGDDDDAWVGKRVTLYATPVKVRGKTVLGIRVKGSPDITQPVTALIDFPRRRPVTMRLVPTGRGEQAQAPARETGAEV